MTEKDGGRQTPMQSAAVPLRVNSSIRAVPEMAVMPTMMPGPGLFDHLILTKHPAHAAEQISQTCSVVSSVMLTNGNPHCDSQQQLEN